MTKVHNKRGMAFAGRPERRSALPTYKEMRDRYRHFERARAARNAVRAAKKAWREMMAGETIDEERDYLC